MGWSCPTFHEVKKAPASLTGLQVRSIVCRRDCSPLDAVILVLNHKSHNMAVQKMQVVVQKMQVEQAFSFVLLLKKETNVRRKENSHEKVRSMPWKARIGRPLP